MIGEMFDSYRVVGLPLSFVFFLWSCWDLAWNKLGKAKGLFFSSISIDTLMIYDSVISLVK